MTAVHAYMQKQIFKQCSHSVLQKNRTQEKKVQHFSYLKKRRKKCV